MAFQRIQGRKVFIIDITDANPKTLLPIHAGTDKRMVPYAKALDTAIRTNLITEPGKYAIEVTGTEWTIHTINEENTR